MADPPIPSWIKKIKEEKEQDATRAEYEAQHAALAAKTIEADGPAFWKQLLEELEITVHSLPAIGVSASMSDLSKQTEEGCQISVARESAFPAIAYVNVFYAPGSNSIRCHPSEGRAFSVAVLYVCQSRDTCAS
jgi:hypothetical protein